MSLHLRRIMMVLLLCATGPMTRADDANNPGFDICVSNAEHAGVPEILDLTYDAARWKVVAAGWQPRTTRQSDGSMKDFDEVEGNQTIFWSRGYTEVGDCAATGDSPCIFNFTDSYGNRLEIVSTGEEGPGHAIVSHVELLCPKS